MISIAYLILLLKAKSSERNITEEVEDRAAKRGPNIIRIRDIRKRHVMSSIDLLKFNVISFIDNL